MSLTWDVSTIVAREGEDYVWPRAEHADPNYGIKAGDRRLSGVTECLIFATMFVGMNRITAANWSTFASRLRTWETVAGPISSNRQPITTEHVRRHIGLATNASAKSATAFANEIGRMITDKADKMTAREIAADATPAAAGSATQEPRP